ncbi:MAG: YcaO-like family protein [Oscillospiraceae bacterium]
MNEWSTYFQNPDFMEKSRIMIINRDMAEYTAKKIGLRENIKVLDVGCGTGEFTFYLSGQCSGVEFYGIDMDEQFIAAAAERAKKDSSGNTFSFTAGDALKLPYDDNFFDIVVSHTFLTSVFDYRGALREMQRVCKPGGTIASVTADTFKFSNGYEGYYPAKYEWLGEYRELLRKVQTLYEAMKPMNSFAVGADTVIIPRVFSEMKMENVSVYPLGKFFSLSNAATPEAVRKRYIELDYSAEIQRLDTIYALPGADDYLSENEVKRYKELIALRRDALLEDLNENEVWEWTGGSNLLIVGKNPEVYTAKAPQSEYEKSKFKTTTPEKTVERLKQVLDSVGFEPEEMDIQSGVGSICSLRVTLKNTNIGQNGKGAAANYARASGYAELMERLQTGYLFQHSFDDEISHCGGFRAGPDERLATASELKELGGKLLEDSVRAIIRESGGMSFMPVDVSEYISRWDFAAENGKFPALPFVSLTDGKTEYLPDCIYRAFYFTNGSCAGNCREEALVQGMSEVAERWAANRILTKKLTPPVIPDEAIQGIPTLAETVREFRMHDEYSLRIMDASCGMGLPVICAAVIDKSTGGVTLRFGAHPRFEVALERTLTEILQGKNIDSMHYSPRYDLTNDDYSQNVVNRFNFLKDATGVFPSELFGSAPSWELTAFEKAPENAQGQLEFMLALYKKLNWTPYVRDCSFLGFNTYHIVVPGESMIFNFGAERLTEKRLAASVQPTLRNMAAASEEERQKAMRYVKLKSGWSLENSFGFMAGLPYYPKLLGIDLDGYLIMAMYDIHCGNYAEAVSILGRYSYGRSGAATALNVLRQLVDVKGKSGDIDKAADFLRVMFSEKYVNEALAVLNDPLGALPKLNCFDCENCREKGKCKMVYAAPVMKNIREKMTENYNKSRKGE